MSDKRYPTRMHEVLTKPGEPPLQTGERFRVKGLNDEFFVNIRGRMMLVVPSGHLPASGEIVAHAINHGITRRPRLTEEQVAQLKALVTLGYGWIVKDLEGLPYACASKPKKERDDWRGGGAFIDLYPFMPTNCLMDLPDWSDPDPLDIVQTLREAGRLEVDDD